MQEPLEPKEKRTVLLKQRVKSIYESSHKAVKLTE